MLRIMLRTAPNENPFFYFTNSQAEREMKGSHESYLAEITSRVQNITTCMSSYLVLQVQINFSVYITRTTVRGKRVFQIEACTIEPSNS
jgi:hypothetical protein